MNLEEVETILMQKLNMAKKYGNRIMALCPFHEDKNPSLAVYLDQFPHYHCFACGAHGTVNELLHKLGVNANVHVPTKNINHFHSTGSDVVDYEELLRLSELYFQNLHRVSSIEYLQGKKIKVNDYHKYWLKRGISIDTLVHMGIGCGKDYRGFFYSIPYWWSDESLSIRSFKVVAIKKIYPHKGRNGKDSYGFYPINISASIYNQPALIYAKRKKKELGIFEGEKDTLLAIENGLLGVGISGKNGFKESYVSLFESIEEVMLWLDNDADAEMDKISRAFDKYRSKHHLPRIKKFNWKVFDLPQGSDYTDLVNLNLIGSGVND